jgi:hypothetical protein
VTTYRPSKNFVRCRFCEARTSIGLHRNSRVTSESVDGIEKLGWIFTGREKGYWTGICPACNLFFQKEQP